MNVVNSEAQKQVWVAPEIRTLDISETQTRSGAGSDGGGRPDCTRS